MRELKFRAWHQGAKEMLFENRIGDVFRWYQEHQPIEIMQFTGLFDFHDKEVWEGDIIKYTVESGENEIGVVRFSKDGFWTSQQEGHSEELLSEELSFEAFEATVIGNIYQNTELINK